MPSSVVHDTRRFKTSLEYKNYFDTKRSELGGMLGFLIRESSSDEKSLSVTYEDVNKNIYHVRFFYLMNLSSGTKFFLQEDRANSIIQSGLANKISIQGDTAAASGAMLSIVQQCFTPEKYQLIQASDHWMSARFVESSVAKMTKLLGQEVPKNIDAEVEEKSVKIFEINPNIASINNLIEKINATMADFVKDSREYRQHVQAVENLKSDLENNRLENIEYFIGRYNISSFFEMSQTQNKEQVNKMIADQIKEKLDLPDQANVLLTRSQDVRYVRVSLHADSLQMYFEQIEKTKHQAAFVTHVSSNELPSVDFRNPWQLML